MNRCIFLRMLNGVYGLQFELFSALFFVISHCSLFVVISKSALVKCGILLVLVICLTLFSVNLFNFLVIIYRFLFHFIITYHITWFSCQYGSPSSILHFTFSHCHLLMTCIPFQRLYWSSHCIIRILFILYNTITVHHSTSHSLVSCQ